MSVCSWDLKWNLLLHTSLSEQIHGQEKKSRQRGREDVTVCVCAHVYTYFAFRKAKGGKKRKKEQSHAFRKEM